MKLLIPALAAGLASIYFISKRRKVEFELDMTMEPTQGEAVAVIATPAHEDEN